MATQQISTSGAMENCVLSYADDGVEAIQCLAATMDSAADKLNSRIDSLSTAMDIFFLIMASIIMFTMQAGFALLCAGSVRKRNVQNTMMKNFLDACGSAVAFYVCGYAFAYGGTGNPTMTSFDDGRSDESHRQRFTFIGTENFFLMGIENYSFWMYQFAFAATATTIVAGALAERSQMGAYFLYSVLLSGFVFPVVAHSIWSVEGFLNAFSSSRLFDSGMIDFAGSGVVHVLGGTAALIAVIILGPRTGRFHDDHGRPVDKPRPMERYSVALQVMGVFLLWFGWYAYNAGSIHFISTEKYAEVVALAALTTTLGASSGAITSLAVSAYWSRHKTGEVIFDTSYALNGCLSGLVSITGGCTLFEPWAALLVGIAAGVIYFVSSKTLLRYRIDDAVDAIPVHLCNGIWGVLSVGLFTSPSRMQDVFNRNDHVGWFYSLGRTSGDARLLLSNIIGLVFIISFVTSIMLPFFSLINYLGWFRADPLEEIVGLDIRYSGGVSVEKELLKHSSMHAVRQTLGAYKKDAEEDGEDDDLQDDTASRTTQQSYSPCTIGWHRSGQLPNIVEELDL